MARFLFPAALATLTLLVACSGDAANDASPTPTASRTSAPIVDTPTAGPSATGAPPADITIGDAVDFPDNVALIVETGCWQCDGPATGFVRVYRRPDGSIAQDILFTVDQLNLPDDGDNAEPSILDFEIKHDASEIVVAVCVTGFCGGLGPAAPGAAAKLYRSTDGGVTWAEWADWPLDHWMIGLVADGVLAGHWTNIPQKPEDPDTTPSSQWEYDAVVLPEGRLIEQPAAADPEVWPVVTELGEVWWPADNGRLLRGDGSVALTLPGRVTYASNPIGLPKSGIAVSWYPGGVGGRLLSFYHSGLVEADELEYDTTLSGITHAGPLDPKSGTLYGNIEAYSAVVPLPTPLGFGLVPALIDVHTFTAHPIVSPFLDGTSILPNGRNRIVAVQRGPFARVTTPGSCLNVRAEPSLSAEVLDCLADGVLLFADSRTTEVDGVAWLEVLHSPSFPHGWVSTAFLER